MKIEIFSSLIRWIVNDYILIKNYSHQEYPDDSGGDEGGADGLHGGDFLLQTNGADDKRKDDAHIAGGCDKRRILGDGEGVENDNVVGLGDDTDGEDAHVT